MKLRLVYRNEALGKAWTSEFGQYRDVEIIEGDICEIECDAIVSPANSFGFMDGSLDLALSERFGWELEKRLQAEIRSRPMGELLVGEALIIATEDEKIPWLISAPTMRVPMEIKTTVNAYLAMKATLAATLGHQTHPAIRSIAIPGLGTGVGALPPEIAAKQMRLANDEIIGKRSEYPATFSEAQRLHVELNLNANLYS
jgi:O-acetyl-ADP-ribose deacetylase (regulator of RNase III)